MQSPDIVTRAAFHEWLDRVLAGDLPSEVVGFVLHLYEGTSTFDAQLAGTTRFDPADPAWAQDEAWSTGEDLFGLDRARTGDSWELAHEQFTNLMHEYFATGLRAELLRRAAVVAMGFVDGDLTLISNFDDDEDT
ncbi:MAG TPA: hypothetical protein VFV49_08810 [Thermoanaerobaculia bacterium]|nr:hypothetical protein [Thermoanaerobaculia bacterium]